jgi:predicted secreted protein
MTTGIAGRRVRIKYDADGAGGAAAVVIARARTDSVTVTNEMIDITAKDDAGVRTLMNDIGVKSMAMSVNGVLAAAPQHRTLVGLAHAAALGAALHTFEIEMEGVGTFRGLWFIASFEASGDEGANAATFTMSLESSGLITWTPAT